MLRKKTIGMMLILTLILGCIFMTSCGGGADSDDNTLVYGSGDYTSINPALYEHGEINSLLFAGLTAHDENDKVVPGLAESWKWNEAEKTYTFKLRDGLTFHDGERLTANDVKFTLDVIRNDKNASEIVSNYEDITDINVVDDLTVKITLKHDNAAFPDYMTIGILPEHAFDSTVVTESEFNTAPIGEGPYKLTNWDRGQSITMERFDGYYQGKPKIEKIIFKIVNDTDARALQLKSGDLDFAQITPKTLSEFEGNDEFATYLMDTADYRAIMYNFNNEFWKENPELPAALSYAIDREAIVKNVLMGHGVAAYSPLQKGDYNNPNIEKYEYDPAKAKELIEAAGWHMGDKGFYEKNGKELAFEINNSQGDQVRIDMSNIIAQNFAEIGVNATVKVEAEIDWENQDTYLIGWGSPFDPDDHTYKVFVTGQAANYGSYSNSKVDELLTQGREHESYEQRLPYYQDFQTELAKDPPYSFIAYIDAVYAGSSNIKGITKDTILGHHGVGIFWNVYEWEITD